MGYIYCIYATNGYVPKYIGMTEQDVKYRFKRHISNALSMQSGSLYQWIRQTWKDGHDINYHVLQENIIPKDLALYENYWISQFSGLLNDIQHQHIPERNSEIGNKVINVIKQANSVDTY